MNPYFHLVSEYASLIKKGKACQLGGFQPARRPEPLDDAAKALFFAPHPDDESIIGGLAVRLLREARMNVINVAVTQGSNKERRAERFRELQGACLAWKELTRKPASTTRRIGQAPSISSLTFWRAIGRG